MSKITIEDKIEQEIKGLLVNKDFVSDTEKFREKIRLGLLTFG